MDMIPSMMFCFQPFPRLRDTEWQAARSVRALSKITGMLDRAKNFIFTQQNGKNDLDEGQNNLPVPPNKFGVPVSDGTPFVSG